MATKTHTTTGQMGMWGGTVDGKPGFVDSSTKSSNVNQPAEIQITVEDVRYVDQKPTLKADGYEMVHYPTSVADECLTNFAANKDVIEDVYARECIKLVKELSGANVVVPYDWKTRYQDAKATDIVEARAKKGGVPVAHVDRDNTSAFQCLTHMFGDEGERLVKTHRRWAAINVWRPIGTTVEKWPLCMVDTRDVPDWKYDTHMDRVKYTNGMNTAYLGLKPHEVILKNHDNYRYYYASNQKPEEAWVFAAFDSDDSKVTPHGAFWDDSSADNAAPRHSFELRTWCFFDEVEDSA